MNLIKLLSELQDIIKVYDGRITDGDMHFHRDEAKIWVQFPNEDELNSVILFAITLKDVS